MKYLFITITSSADEGIIPLNLALGYSAEIEQKLQQWGLKEQHSRYRLLLDLDYIDANGWLEKSALVSDTEDFDSKPYHTVDTNFSYRA